MTDLGPVVQFNEDANNFWACTVAVNLKLTISGKRMVLRALNLMHAEGFARAKFSAYWRYYHYVQVAMCGSRGKDD